jgi:hypothetical protein
LSLPGGTVGAHNVGDRLAASRTLFRQKTGPNSSACSPGVKDQKPVAKLAAFEELPAGELIDGLQRFAKRRFKPAERAEWDEYLAEKTRQLAAVKRAIADNMAALNEQVDRLYGLSDSDLDHLRHRLTG